MVGTDEAGTLFILRQRGPIKTKGTSSSANQSAPLLGWLEMNKRKKIESRGRSTPIPRKKNKRLRKPFLGELVAVISSGICMIYNQVFIFQTLSTHPLQLEI